MSKLTIILFKGATMLVFLFGFGNVFAQTQNVSKKENVSSQKQEVEKTNQLDAQTPQPLAEKFQITTTGEPQGNTLEAQIARAEFYKAQYAHDPATQAKYQQNIDRLKKELMDANTKSKE